MRIDLAYDFQKVFKTFFQEFINKNEQKTPKNKVTLSMDFVCFKGESIFKGTLYFCCQKAYYNLNPEIFKQVEKKDHIVFKRHNHQWEPCVDIHDKALVRELTNKYHYVKKDTIRVIDYSYLRHDKLQFYIGFCVDRKEGHQVFYIWAYTVPIPPINKQKLAVLEHDKLHYIAFHKLFLKFLKKQKQEEEPYTVEEFFNNKVINRKTFQKKHKESLGTTFYDYYLRIRLLDALKLIIATSEPIKSIPSKVDCEDYSVLSKAFKKNQFLSPSKYRDTHFFK